MRHTLKRRKLCNKLKSRIKRKCIPQLVINLYSTVLLSSLTDSFYLFRGAFSNLLIFLYYFYIEHTIFSRENYYKLF